MNKISKIILAVALVMLTSVAKAQGGTITFKNAVR